MTEDINSQVWRRIADVPADADPTQQCVAVWQDSEHPPDQGVQVCTFAEIASGKFVDDRIEDAWWRSLEKPNSQSDGAGWIAIGEIPKLQGDPPDEDWGVRGIVAINNGKDGEFRATNLYVVKDGGWDFANADLWLSIMDAPPMIAYKQKPSDEDAE